MTRDAGRVREETACSPEPQDLALSVALKRDIGAAIPKALLIVDLTWLVERLRERLQAVKDGAASHGATADDVLRPEAVRTADAEPHRAVLRGGRRMNEDQERAVRRSLGSRTTFVWGPPGTGKTWTLARVVEAHYRAGRSVLLVSHTNVAVDTALEQVAERLCGEAAFDRGLVLRRGPIVREELRGRFGSQINPGKVAARLNAPLQHERKALEREAVDLKAEDRSLAAVRRDVEEREAGRSDAASRELPSEAEIRARGDRIRTRPSQNRGRPGRPGSWFARSSGNARRGVRAGSRAPQHADGPAEIQALALPPRSRVRVDADPRRRQPSVHRRQRPPVPGRSRRCLRQRPPVGSQERHPAAGIHLQTEAVLVHCPVVPPAQQDEVRQRRLPVVGPVLDVMSIAAPGRAAREAALPVARRQRPPQRGGDGPRPAAHVENAAGGTVPHRDGGGVAGDTARRLLPDADTAVLGQRPLRPPGVRSAAARRRPTHRPVRSRGNVPRRIASLSFGSCAKACATRTCSRARQRKRRAARSPLRACDPRLR